MLPVCTGCHQGATTHEAIGHEAIGHEAIGQEAIGHELTGDSLLAMVLLGQAHLGRIAGPARDRAWALAISALTPSWPGRGRPRLADTCAGSWHRAGS